MLKLSLGSIAGHAVRVRSLLWYACSFIGIALVFAAFRTWQSKSSPAPAAVATKTRWLGALLVAIAVLPIELAHHLLRNWIGMLAVTCMTLLLLLFILRKSRPAKVTVPW
jgi:cell division protein FtsW (lipid II flippase)